MKHDPRSAVRSVLRVGRVEEEFDRVVVEEPLEIRANGESIAVTMRTPGDDEELSVGFLLTEGVLRARSDVVGVARVEPNVIDVALAPGVDAGAAKRALYSASSCGLCGKGTLTAIAVAVPRIESEVRFPLEALLAMPAALRAAQATFDRTGGLHAAGVFDARGEVVLVREDVGRHNATDKALGRRFLDGAPLDAHALLVSGRAGFEIVQKAAVARVPLVASISAPSSLAIDLADRLGITLVGFLRPPQASVYTHSSRVVS